MTRALGWLRDEAGAAVCALMLLTRVPVPGSVYTPERLRRSVAWFPPVGALVGVVAGAVLLAAGELWTGLLPVVLAVAVPVVLTGGLHEDGLADCADALGVAGGRDARLAVLKDPHVGTYGVLALVLGIAAKIAALAALAPLRAAAALVLAHALGRWAAAFLLRRLPYLRGRDGSAGGLEVGGGRFAVLSVVAGALAGLLGWPGAVAAAAALATAELVAFAARHKLGGATGDVLGAGCQLVELAVYATLAAVPTAWWSPGAWPW